MILNEIVEYCAKTNTEQFNFNKALEEAAEFSDALIKYQTKADSNPKKPTKEDILGEYGDFSYRGLIAILTLFPELSFDEVLYKIKTHVSKKIDKLQEWREAGTYTNGL